MSRVIIKPQGPFDLQATIDFLNSFVPAGDRGLQPPGHLHLAFPLDACWTSVGVCLQAYGTDLSCDIFGDAAADLVRLQVERVLSLDVDGTGYVEIGRRDPVIGRLQAEHRFLRPANFYSPYEAAVWAILCARGSMRQAARLKTHIATSLGQAVDIHGHRLPTFPSPGRLLALEDLPGVGERKLTYLHTIARETLAGHLEASRLRAMSGNDAIDYLRSLPGIGPFSADHILLRGAGAPDCLTSHEPRVLRAVAYAYGLPSEPDMSTFNDMAEAWKPFRTWVLVLLRVHLPAALSGYQATRARTPRRPAN